MIVGMALEGGKAAWAAFKAHWGWFLLGIAALIIAALWYDHKEQGGLTKKVAGLPLVGGLFACLALFFALGGAVHRRGPPVIDMVQASDGVYTTRTLAA